MRPRVRRAAPMGAALVLSVLVGLVPPATPAVAAPAKINGSGSSYVALAMQQWVADAQTSGLSVNYLPTGSPQGLTGFAQALIDFAGTEAEYSALGGGRPDARGFQYVPDVAGAVAIMYNVVDRAGRKVDYLHLSRSTVARIFMGDISRWSDGAITADNKGLELPDEPINVVYRGGQSGTTALFYDFVSAIEPQIFARWAARNELPTQVRIIQLDSAPGFAPKTQALNGSDQIAQFVAGNNGRWSIAYDEFGYAKTYHAPAAWIENQSGAFVQPYAENISAALESARLRDDLSQELSGVYTSSNPDAYPISAYSYLVTQCAAAPDRPTCAGAYTNSGVTETLARWMRYIACEGQVNMGRIGYSPLPPNLSQELVNSIARLDGSAPEQLNADNCANPRFRGVLGEGTSSPVDPLANITPGGGGPVSADTGTNADGGGTGAGGAGAASGDGAATAGDSAGGAGGTGPTRSGTAIPGIAGAPASAVGGGSGSWRQAAPVAYDRPTGSQPSSRPIVLLLALLAVPPIFSLVRRIGGPA